jgi:hypothetical protein
MSSSAELERKAEQARQRLKGRLADLRYHVSPSTVANDLLGIDLGAIGKDIVPAITQEVRRNPVAVALIAAGVGLLIYSDFAQPAMKTKSMRGKRRKRGIAKKRAARH